MDHDTAASPEPQPRQTERGISRRALLRGTAIAAGGAAMLAGSALPAEAKMPKKVSHYRDTPKGKAQCSNCQHFEPPHSCGIVAGKISPHGWCRFYLKK